MLHQKCPLCNGSNFFRGSQVLADEYKGDLREVEVTGDFCHDCGESFLDSESSARYMAALGDQRIEVDGQDEMDRRLIRKVRVNLGLTQDIAVPVFGGKPGAFQAYERGHERPPAYLSLLFHFLDHLPERERCSRFCAEFKVQWFGGAVAMIPGTGLFFWMDLMGSKQWLQSHGLWAVAGVAASGLLITALAAAWITLQQLQKAKP